MSNRPFKHCSFKRGMIGMCIEVIPAEVGEIRNVCFSDRPLMSDQGIADLQLFKIFPERMLFILDSIRTLEVDIRDRGNRIWVTLEGYTLHVMMYSTNASHFFTSSSPARTSMGKHGQRRSMTCTFFRRFP